MTAADRIPLADLKQIVRSALAQGDYEHDTEWVRPESCPCHGLGLERCTQYDGIHGKCQGYPAEVPTPEQHLVNAEILNAALPAPDADGTVDKQQAATAILRVITGRLSGDYILRAHSLVKRLREQAEEYEQPAGLTGSSASDIPEDAGPWLPLCQWCGQRCKDRRARFCSRSHKQLAYKRRKREQG